MRDFGWPVPQIFSRCLRQHEDGHRRRRRHYGDMPWKIATIMTTDYLYPHNHEDRTIYRRRKDGDMRIGGRDAGVSDVVTTYGDLLVECGSRTELQHVAFGC